jgi:low temperature requirement protein LtrA
VIIALGESIVVLGVGTEELDIGAKVVLFALLALALSAALWWVYFSDENAVEDAFHDAPPDRRPQLALQAFGYWHYGLLLAVIAVAAGLKKAIGHPYDDLDGWVALALGAGTALFIVADAGFRRTFGLPRNATRLVAALIALVTIPLGTAVGGAAQVAALALIVGVAVVAGGGRARGGTGDIPR